MQWWLKALMTGGLGAVTVSPAFGQCTAKPNSPAADGGFGVIGGTMYDPHGNPFVPHGIASDLDASTALDILAKFPGINLVRIGVGDMSTQPQKWADGVNILTSHGVAVVFEDHTSSDGSNRGGGVGVEFTGSELDQEKQWYTAMGAFYKNNPYVWATSTNEPSIVNTSGQTDMAGLVSWQQQLYSAWRSSGNTSPFGFSTVGGWMNQSINPGMALNAYTNATNTFLDEHFYNGDASFSGSQTDIASTLADQVSQAQRFQSADGVMPVYHFEYGPSSMGPTADPGGMATVAAVQAANNGSAAWINHSGAEGSDNLFNGSSLSQFGQEVASYLATSGATGCAVSALPSAADLSSADNQNLLAGINAVNGPASPPSAAEVQATLADLTPADSGLTVEQVASLATTGQPIVRTSSSPGGTSPPPPTVTGASTPMTVTQDYAAAAPSGNNTITVSGRGDIVVAANGHQTVTVTGPGSTIRLGPYDDTITLRSTGNTVNGGGGNDTVILSYTTPTDSISGSEVTDATVYRSGVPATPTDTTVPAPLGIVGNILTAPAPGTGVLTIQGTMQSTDRIDLTQALAGHGGWNHQPERLAHFVEVGDNTISVGGIVVVKFSGTMPTGIGQQITAS